ncbi:MAG TPA: hypothetical protein VFP57_03820 [Sphingomicrobium sp.]|nr:hypothetical protein [Sphingomicrobium sp.]
MSEAVHPKPIVLNVGITGHRAGALTAPLVRTLRPVVFTVFRELRDATLKLQQAEDALCSATEAQLRLHTPLATGADQIAAICARSSGYFVRALLPFEPSEYRNDFLVGEELDRFEQALAAADEIVALPGRRSDPEGAYVLVGESLVQTADVLIAIWDGEQARGPGGTAHVVELALQSSVPVIHIDIDRASDSVRMRALVEGGANGPLIERPDDRDLYSEVLRNAFRLPPSAAAPGTGRRRASGSPA